MLVYFRFGQELEVKLQHLLEYLCGSMALVQPVHQNCKQKIHHEQDSANHPWIRLLESLNLSLIVQCESLAKS